LLDPRRIAQVVVAAVLAIATAGCDIDQLQNGGLQVASSTDGAGARTADTGRNPFGEGIPEVTGPREIIQTPSLAEVLKPSPLPEMALGRQDAPVTIVQYASMTCPYCRQFAATVFPQLKRDYIDKGKVRYVLREFPIGFQSGNATIALRCAKPEKYFALYDRLMARQNMWVSMEVRTEPILAAAGDLGPTRAQFDACKQNQDMINALNTIKDRGRTLGVIGTPNFFINERLVKTTLDYEQLKALIDPIIAGKGTVSGRS
jgi:protein-disulfide isomerase